MTKFHSGEYFLLLHGNHFSKNDQYSWTQNIAVFLARSCCFIDYYAN